MQSGRDRRSERRIAFSAVISAFVLANLLVPLAFDGMTPSRFYERVGFFLSGGLVAEACVLAIWGAMAASPAKYRIPVSAGLLLVGVCTCVVGFRAIDDTFPLSVALLLVGLALGMFTGLLVPLWLVRLVTGQQITVPGETPARLAAQSSVQFGLRYLLMGPVVVSGVYILLRYSLPHAGPSIGPNIAEILEILFGAFVFMAFSAAICMPCIWLTLAERHRGRAAVLLALIALGGPWFALTLLQVWYGAVGQMWEAVFITVAFGCGLVMPTLLLLYLMRSLGYRLVGRRGEDPFGAIVAETVEATPSDLSPLNSEVQ